MEIYVQLILVMALAKYCLKAALTGRLWIMSLYAAFASAIALALYPIVITQPVTIVEQMLTSHTFVTNGAVITTMEAIFGIFLSIYLLDNYFTPKQRRRKSLFLLKVVPGILAIFAIAYFELLFFKWRVGGDFLTTALYYAGALFGAIFGLSALIKYAMKSESMKLEMKLMLNLGILGVGLLVNSTVADYNLSYAETVVEWGALLVIVGMAALLFGVGVLMPRIKKLFKQLLRTG